MIEILQSMFSEHRGIKLEINNIRKFGNYGPLWNLNPFLNNEQSNEDITKEIRIHFGINANKNTY